MIKDYRSRVIGTYDFLRAALIEVNNDPDRLIRVGREADQRAVPDVVGDARHAAQIVGADSTHERTGAGNGASGSKDLALHHG